MAEQNSLSAGTQVRLRNDPGRLGVLTGKYRERAGTVMYQVTFPEGKSYQPEYELDVVTDDSSDVYTLLVEGRFGRVSDLRRNLSHIQLSGRLANLVYSMDTTNTEFYAYQFKPVLSFLESPSNGLLIADEVGLGKTIEAGLIWTELRARYDARRLVVVCPAMLREKWRDELRERFGVEADIMDVRDLLSELRRNKHEIQDGKGIVCSLQGLRPPRRWWDDDDTSNNPRKILARFLEEQADNDPVIDLLIIDEAHYLRNPESQSAKLGQLLRGVSENVLLLSATPINLRDEDLFHLLNLVDPDSFDVKEVFPQVLAANEPLQKARELALDMRAGIDEIKELLLEAKEHHLLVNSLQLQDLIETEFTPEVMNDKSERIRLANRIERINLLRHAVNRTRKIEVTEWKVVRDPYTEFIDLNEQEWEFYQNVTQAITQYAIRADISEGFLLASPQRQVSSCMYAAAKAWGLKQGFDAEQIYGDFGIELDESDGVSPLIEHLTRSILPAVDLQALRNGDSKYERFRKVLIGYLKKNPNEKVVVFSYFRGTLSYLSERLKEDGIKNQILVGGLQRAKQDIIDEFRDDESIRVLLSSEVASEGVDLQFCRVLINYDLPWNPMKVEQRIGRIDRIGQTSEKISIWNLCYANTIDHRIHERLFERLGIFKRALGGMEAILGEQIEALTSDLLSTELTEEQQNKRIEQTALAIERIRQDQDELERQVSHLIAHGGYILEQVQAAHEFKKRITEQDLVVYVKDYLEKYCQGHHFIQVTSNELIFDIRLPSKTAAALDDFIRRKKLYGQTRLATGEEVRCQFINKVRRSTQRIEPISQFHPFIRFISEDLRVRDEAFYPLVAINLPHRYAGGLAKGRYAFAVSLWCFSGLRVEEELRARAIRLGDDAVLSSDISWDLINSARIAGVDWLSVSNEIDRAELGEAIDICAVELENDFKQISREKDNENKDRVSFQIQSAERHKERQLKTHYRVLEELRATGHVKLIPAREGLIRKVKERFDVQVEKLKTKTRLGSSSFEVCFGVISVE